jgi:septal ring factor EnvC (AmiA/AmiB activator)
VRLRAIAAFLALVWPLAAGANGDAYSGQADRAAALIAEAGARLKAAESENRLAAFGEAVSAYEAGLAAIRGGLRILAAREAQLTVEIAEGRQAYRDMLGLLLTLERTPTPALLTHPLGPMGHARAARMMAEIAPKLERRTNELRAKLFDLRDIRERQDAAQAEIRAALAAMQAARAALAAALRTRVKPPKLALKPQDIANSARSFSEFAEALRATSPNGGGDARFSAALGALPPPVVGEITLRFGEKDEAGDPINGVRVSAPAYALVTAPWSATIRYAGALANLGNVVILEPEEGRLIVLAGLARIDRYAGETVFPGEPLGQLGVIEHDSEEFLIEATADEATMAFETLYIEVRVNGAPADPAAWFAFSE